MIEARHLIQRFHSRRGEVVALDGVSLSLQAGELVIVRGPSGCGKTTLLFAIGGLRAPQSGEVRFGAWDLYRDMSSERRAVFRSQTIGFVFQQYHLIPYLNVLENVLTPAIVRPDPAAEARARDLLEHFGLRDRLNHRPAELSTGERQRTALARALLNQPRLLLADEPTGNLDETNTAIVLEALRAFVRDGGTVLMASHDERAFPKAHRVLRMMQGRIVS